MAIALEGVNPGSTDGTTTTTVTVTLPTGIAIGEFILVHIGGHSGGGTRHHRPYASQRSSRNTPPDDAWKQHYHSFPFPFDCEE
jgi:hypothetical protein